MLAEGRLHRGRRIAGDGVLFLDENDLAAVDTLALRRFDADPHPAALYFENDNFNIVIDTDRLPAAA